MEVQKQSRSAKSEEDNATIVEGSGNYVPNAVRGLTPRSAEENKAKIRKLMDEERRLVKGKFMYHECPGGHVEVFMRKYKDLPVFQQTLIDGREYEVPLWVARSLNGIDKASAAYEGVIHSGAWPIYKHEATTDWNNQIQHLQPVGTWKRRYSFAAMDFVT